MCAEKVTLTWGNDLCQIKLPFTYTGNFLGV